MIFTNKKIHVFFMVLMLVFSFVLFSETKVFAQNDGSYTLLEDLNDKFQGDQNRTNLFSRYLGNLYQIILGGAAILTVLSIAYGGIQYITSAAVDTKSAARSRMTSSLLGFLLILSAYLILNTINPDLVKLNLCLPRLGDESDTCGKPSDSWGKKVNSPNNNTTPQSNNSCSGCTVVTAGYNFPAKTAAENGCSGAGPCQVNGSLALKLNSVHSNMSGIPWRVTEMYPPTRQHKHPCHQNGTCVDASVTNKTTSNISMLYGAATRSGLRAEYEVTSNTRKDQLISEGYTGKIIVVPGITGEHFSLYLQ